MNIGRLKSVSVSNRSGTWYRFIKRTLDLFLAGAALVAFSPLLGLIAILVRVTSPGPTFFRQKRLGLNGSIFTIFKFRTMVVHEEASLSESFTHSADPRITPLGRILRDFRLDELPQLFNVIRGEMSIIGPRPLLPEFLAYYTERDKQRLALRPGITGWQQVNGGAQRAWTERIALDVWYIDNASIWLDLKILWRTIGVALTREGVYASNESKLSLVPDAVRPMLAQEFENEGNRISGARESRNATQTPEMSATLPTGEHGCERQ
jgi:lipopolysaccharide/colanic/teichoic acid biosynthesis glycosyltransferase